MHPIYGRHVFYEAKSIRLVKKMLGGQQFASGSKQSFFSSLDSRQHCSLHREFRSLVTVGTKCFNEIGLYVEK